MSKGGSCEHTRPLFSLFPLLCCLLLGSFLVFRATTKPAGPTVQVWLTTSDGSNQLTPQANLIFGSDPGNSSTITVNEYQELQQMDGFGAAVTNSSAWLIYNKMGTSQRAALMQSLQSHAGHRDQLCAHSNGRLGLFGQRAILLR